MAKEDQEQQGANSQEAEQFPDSPDAAGAEDSSADKTQKKEKRTAPELLVTVDKKGGPGLFAIALLTVNLLILAAVFSVLYYTKFYYEKPVITDEDVKSDIKEAADGLVEFIEYKLDPFTVNLSKAKGDKYVNARFTLIAVDWNTRDELDRKVDKVRDAVIKILNSKYPEELITVQGKLFLKDQIVTRINRILSMGSVREVYIESFVIQ